MSKAPASVFTKAMELQITWHALTLLRKSLGSRVLIQVGFSILWLRLLGKPFKDLPKATSREEIFSRRQVGPAIVLYLALRKRFSVEDALAAVKPIIVESTLIFLTQAVGPINQSHIRTLSESERQSWLQVVAGQFLNATIRWNKVASEQVSFTITQCYFPGLCRDAGVQELAPLFCAGDAVYFSETQEGVNLVRPTTIAGGDKECLFEMELVNLPTRK